MLLDSLLKCQSRRQNVSEFLITDPYTPESLTPDLLKSGTITPGSPTPDVIHPDVPIDRLGSKLMDLASSIRDQPEPDRMDHNQCEMETLENINIEIKQPRAETPRTADEVPSDAGDLLREETDLVSLGHSAGDARERSEEQLPERNSPRSEKEKTPETGNTQMIKIDVCGVQVEDLKPEHEHLKPERAVGSETETLITSKDEINDRDGVRDVEDERMKALDGMDDEFDARVSEAETAEGGVTQCVTRDEWMDHAGGRKQDQLVHEEAVEEECNDHVITEGFEVSSLGQEELLSPQEIYRV